MHNFPPSGKSPKSPWIILAATFMIVAGVVHLAAAPDHWDHGRAHGLLLGVAGVLETLWGLAFLFRPSAWLYRTGLILAVVLITVWAITRWMPAPFGHHGPGEIDTAGVISKLCEGLATTALVALAVSGAYYAKHMRGAAWRAVGALVVAGIVLGWASYGLARVVEPIIPPALPAQELPADPHHHGESEPHDHHEEGESPHHEH